MALPHDFPSAAACRHDCLCAARQAVAWLSNAWLSMGWLNIAWLIGVALTAGCQPAADIRPADVRTYTVPRSAAPSPRPAGGGGGPASPAAPSGGPAIQYDVPEGWVDAGASGMRLATLRTGPGDPAKDPGVGEITIIPASGTLEGNATRWQQQLTPSADPEKVARAIAEAEKVSVNGVESTILLLLDDAPENQQAILAAVVPIDPSTSLFVKFKGAADLARNLRDPFTTFVRSIRWQ